MLLRAIAFSFVIGAMASAHAKIATADVAPSVELKAPVLPLESAWIDLRQNASASSSSQSAPNWVQEVTAIEPEIKEDVAARTTFRLRISPPPGESYPVLLVRLFFYDDPARRPSIIAWDELGTQVLHSGPLGDGIGLQSSDSAIIPMAGISAIEIEVPGDGKTVRGALLEWMTSEDTLRPVNTKPRMTSTEPFSLTPPLESPNEDTEQFGTVTASLSAATIRIGPSVQDGAAFQFGVEAQPLMAVLTFEVAGPRVDAPPEIYLNGEALGAVSLVLPELADPGYRGQMESLVKEMKFHYTGWLRAQMLIPADRLRAGTNDLLVLSGAGSPAAAIRATQLQLKYLWEKSDYTLQSER